MKKVGFTILAITAVVVGLIIGTLNADVILLDLLWIQLEIPLGLAILLGFSLGLVTGLSMIYLLRVLPLNFQLRRARTALNRLNDDPQGHFDQDKPTLTAPDD